MLKTLTLMNKMKTKINERIKELRTALGLSQTEFAYQAGVSHSLLTKIEAGDNEPTTKFLSKISEKWDVPQDWLINGKGEMSFSTKKESSNPWESEAWVVINSKLSHMEDEIKFYRELLKGNFLQLVKETA